MIDRKQFSRKKLSSGLVSGMFITAPERKHFVFFYSMLLSSTNFVLQYTLFIKPNQEYIVCLVYCKNANCNSSSSTTLKLLHTISGFGSICLQAAAVKSLTLLFRVRNRYNTKFWNTATSTALEMCFEPKPSASENNLSLQSVFIW